MFKVQIKNISSQLYTHGAQFETQALAQEWIDSQLAKGLRCPWGKPEHQCELFDESGLSFDPPQFMTVPSEFEIDGPHDISAEVERARTNAEALAYLASTDWLVVRFMETGVEIPEDVSQARQDARERIVR